MSKQIFKSIGKDKKKRKLMIISVFVILGVTLGIVGSYFLLAETGGVGGVGGGFKSVDVSFSKWSYNGIIPGRRHILDKGTYIEIDNDVWGTFCTARLGFAESIEGTWKFKYKHFGSSGAAFKVRSGTQNIIEIIGSQYTGRRLLRVRGLPNILIVSSNDKAWHDISISWRIAGANSQVTVIIDGVTKVDKQVFSSPVEGIDNIYYQCAGYYIGYGATGAQEQDLTHLKLTSLIIPNVV